MLSKIGRSSRRARSSASLPQGYQSTGLWACCSRYGLVSCARRVSAGMKGSLPRRDWRGARLLLLCPALADSRSDEQLMAAYVAGDAAAFRAIFERYAPLLMRAMLRELYVREEANDLVQQTFL